MRLIDALELKRSIAASALVEDGKHIFDIIDDQPTIEERKTGRWEGIHIDVANDDKGRSYRFYSCTACGFTSFPAILAMEKELMNFCPNCGARMEG